MPREDMREGKVPCETCDCQNRAEVYVSCEGEGAYPYCRTCAELLLRNGETELGAVDDPVVRERDAARAHAENLAEALDEVLIGGADAVSMEHAKRTAKVVLRSYRKARDAT